MASTGSSHNALSQVEMLQADLESQKATDASAQEATGIHSRVWAPFSTHRHQIDSIINVKHQKADASNSDATAALNWAARRPLKSLCCVVASKPCRLISAPS